MVAIKNNGKNCLMFGQISIKSGMTEIKDDDFYRLMKHPLFRFRIENRIFEVPVGFPLEKLDGEATPVSPLKEEEPKELEKVEVEKEDEEVDNEETNKKRSKKSKS